MSKSSMRTPLETVRGFLAAMEAKDYDTGVKFLASDCEYANPGVLPTVHGPAGVRSLLEPFFAPVETNEFVILRTAAEGRTVFMERLDRHRVAGRWVELPVTGVFDVENGLITRWADYFNGPTILDVWPK